MFKKGKTNTIATVILLIAIYILNIIDYLQTVYAVQILGIGVELNPIGRFCLEHNIALPVKVIGMLVILSIIGIITIKIEPRYICVSYAIFVSYIVVIWHNFAQSWRAGILAEEQAMTTIAITSFVLAVLLGGVCGGLLAYIKHLKKK